jgi:hypothetical protein
LLEGTEKSQGKPQAFSTTTEDRTLKGTNSHRHFLRTNTQALKHNKTVFAYKIRKTYNFVRFYEIGSMRRPMSRFLFKTEIRNVQLRSMRARIVDSASDLRNSYFKVKGISLALFFKFRIGEV